MNTQVQKMIEKNINIYSKHIDLAILKKIVDFENAVIIPKGKFIISDS